MTLKKKSSVVTIEIKFKRNFFFIINNIFDFFYYFFTISS